MKAPGCLICRGKIVAEKFNWCLVCGIPVQYALRCKVHEAEQREKRASVSRKLRRIAKKRTEQMTDWRRLRTQVRRLRSKDKAMTDIPLNTLYRLRVHQNFRCACCGVPLLGKYEVDHIHPIAKGGEDLNHPNNLQLLTKKCNGQKYMRDPIVFMRNYRPDYVKTWARQLLVWRNLNKEKP